MEISKRDHFAAHALTGLISHGLPTEDDPSIYERAASEAFQYADAMMKLSTTLFDPVEIDPVALGQKKNEGKEEPRVRPSV